MLENNIQLRETHIVGEQTREYIVGARARPALDLYHIALAGISYAHPPFAFVRHRPSISQVLISLAGSGEVLVDREWLTCEPGMVYLTPAAAPHAYHARADQVWKVGWIMYNEEQSEFPLIPLQRPLLVSGEVQELALAIEGLYAECMGEAEDTLMYQWTHLIDTYVRRIIRQKTDDRRLTQLWKHVDARLASPWTNQALAELAGMSCEHLRRLCQQHYGCSPMKRVTWMRMQRAMVLLTGEGESIGQVALRVGYGNPFAFSTAFKRHTGVAPSLYRGNSRAYTSG